MIRRNIRHKLKDALADTPVVFLNGARQTGKSTLAQEAQDARYFTLDDATTLAAVSQDPAGFLAGTSGPLILDEVQRAPALFPAIKALVDRKRDPGRFLLTGSADVLLLPKVSESLAGRMEILTLWPFSAGELDGVEDSFIDAAFSKGALPVAAPITRDELLRRIVAGGYPEAVARTSASRRAAWFESYIMAILQRDVRDIANIEHLTAMPRLLRLLAVRSSTLLNYSEISRALGYPMSTVKRYMALLEMTFLTQTVPPWSGNLGKRLVKSPKVYLSDTGLAAHLLGVEADSDVPGHLLGALVESFVVMELRKQLGWCATRAGLYHYRDQSGAEVDIVLENAAGQVVAIEVKASATVQSSDIRHMKNLREQLGKRFVRGVVLHLGQEAVPFDKQLSAMPLNTLWR